MPGCVKHVAVSLVTSQEKVLGTRCVCACQLRMIVNQHVKWLIVSATNYGYLSCSWSRHSWRSWQAIPTSELQVSKAFFCAEQGSDVKLPTFLVQSVDTPLLWQSKRCHVLSHLREGIQAQADENQQHCQPGICKYFWIALGYGTNLPGLLMIKLVSSYFNHRHPST